MNILYISGSHRKEGNTDFLLHYAQNITGGEFLHLIDYKINFCGECWKCLEHNDCILKDDFTQILVPKLLQMDALVLGTPVFFNNVSARMKNFMDRTWYLRKKLKNKIGGTIVVGRAYGHQAAIDTISSFYLKHEMIPANRGVSAFGYEKKDTKTHPNDIKATDYLSHRILDLLQK